MIHKRILSAKDLADLNIDLSKYKNLFRSKKVNAEFQKAVNEAGISGKLHIPLTLLKNLELEYLVFEEEVSVLPEKSTSDDILTITVDGEKVRMNDYVGGYFRKYIPTSDGVRLFLIECISFDKKNDEITFTFSKAYTIESNEKHEVDNFQKEITIDIYKRQVSVTDDEVLQIYSEEGQFKPERIYEAFPKLYLGEI